MAPVSERWSDRSCLHPLPLKPLQPQPRNFSYYSPATYSSWVRFPAGPHTGFSHVGIVPDDAAGRWCFLGVLPFPPPLHSGPSPYPPRFTSVGSQGADVHSRPNLTHECRSFITTGVSQMQQDRLYSRWFIPRSSQSSRVGAAVLHHPLPPPPSHTLANLTRLSTQPLNNNRTITTQLVISSPEVPAHTPFATLSPALKTCFPLFGTRPRPFSDSLPTTVGRVTKLVKSRVGRGSRPRCSTHDDPTPTLLQQTIWGWGAALLDVARTTTGTRMRCGVLGTEDTYAEFCVKVAQSGDGQADRQGQFKFVGRGRGYCKQADASGVVAVGVVGMGVGRFSTSLGYTRRLSPYGLGREHMEPENARHPIHGPAAGRVLALLHDGSGPCSLYGPAPSREACRKFPALGVAVVCWIDYPPPTQSNWVRFPAGSLPNPRKWESYQRMALANGPPPPPPPESPELISSASRMLENFDWKGGGTLNSHPVRESRNDFDLSRHVEDNRGSRSRANILQSGSVLITEVAGVWQMYFNQIEKISRERTVCGAVVDQRLESSPHAKDEAGSIPSGVAPVFSFLGIVPHDVADRGVFVGVYLPPPCIPGCSILTSLHPHLLSSPRWRAAQTSSLVSKPSSTRGLLSSEIHFSGLLWHVFSDRRNCKKRPHAKGNHRVLNATVYGLAAPAVFEARSCRECITERFTSINRLLRGILQPSPRHLNQPTDLSEVFISLKLQQQVICTTGSAAITVMKNVVTVPMKPKIPADEARLAAQKSCHICKKQLGIDTVVNNDHLTGEIKSCTHNCNLNVRLPKKQPVAVYHNLQNYYAHFLIKPLAENYVTKPDGNVVIENLGRIEVIEMTLKVQRPYVYRKYTGYVCTPNSSKMLECRSPVKFWSASVPYSPTDSTTNGGQALPSPGALITRKNTLAARRYRAGNERLSGSLHSNNLGSPSTRP
ncbi:hypothetical protein PR048_024682 [Dryococelus australis]|uniref:Uncharacterized protein n=1 Tax=Dryococelus australis TaxID=614101 RepID=A0ABQ9GPB7_9NEOP|nr:hypothetical protein PR048_024682 [Dryococelus australis]